MLEFLGFVSLLLGAPLAWAAFRGHGAELLLSALVVVGVSVVVTVAKLSFVALDVDNHALSLIASTAIEEYTRFALATVILLKFAKRNLHALALLGYLYGVVEVFVNYNTIAFGSISALFGADIDASPSTKTVLLASGILFLRPMIHACFTVAFVAGLQRSRGIFAAASLLLHIVLNFVIVKFHLSIYDVESMDQLFLVSVTALAIAFALAARVSNAESRPPARAR